MNEALAQLAQLDVSVNLKEWLWVWALMYGGPMFLGLVWFAWRAEGRMNTVGDKLDNLSHKLHGMTRAMLLDVATREFGNSALKQAALDLLAKMPANGESHDKT